MTPRVDAASVDEFRAWIARRIGLHRDPEDADALRGILGERLEAARRPDVPAYLSWVESAAGRDEFRRLVGELTVSETYFFRHSDHFRALDEAVLPERLAAAGGVGGVRVLSAGCSSGEEAYSLAILLRERGLESGAVLAVDIDAEALERARRGRYTAWSLREAPAEWRSRWFRPDGGEHVLDERIRRAVAFEERNLLEDDPVLWAPEAYDAVFCRNVLMYFTVEAARLVVSRIAASLKPGGCLFLGHAETLRGISEAFRLQNRDQAFFYRRRERAEVPLRIDRPSPVPNRALPPLDASWFDVIRDATDRISRLASAPAPQKALVASDVARARDLLAEERFAEGATLLESVSRRGGADPGARLLHAALLVHAGRAEEAEKIGAQLLEEDELDAGAHFVAALCREHVGDLEGAARHDRMAAHLDPTFAMPPLHLGLMARRAGRAEEARREFACALERIAREDSTRLALFGGGFRREALEDLCRRQAGGAP